jgi:hypothetical protein
MAPLQALNSNLWKIMRRSTSTKEQNSYDVTMVSSPSAYLAVHYIFPLQRLFHVRGVFRMLPCLKELSVYVHTHAGAGQNDGNTKTLNRIWVGYIEELQLATLNVLPFVYTM